MKSIVIVGSDAKLVVQVMLAVHSQWEVRCVVIGDERCRRLSRSSLCGKHFELLLDGTQDELFVAAVNQLAFELHQAILVPADCDGARAVSRCLARLYMHSIPVLPVKQIDLFDDKWRFYQFCREYGFTTPDTIFLGRKEDVCFDEIVAQLGLPFVLKPTDQFGSHGVHIVYSREYFDREIYSNPAYVYRSLIAQRYIAGEDGGLSFLALNGEVRAYAIQKYVRNGIDFLSNPYLEKAVHQFCEASAYNGLANVDVRLAKETGEVYFIEVNPRVWASSFASVWCGLNFIAESIEQRERDNGPLVLLNGHFHDRRHPLIWPASWPYLLLDRGTRGRLTRAMTFDGFLLQQFLASIPLRATNYFKRRILPKGPLTRPNA